MEHFSGPVHGFVRLPSAVRDPRVFHRLNCKKRVRRFKSITRLSGLAKDVEHMQPGLKEKPGSGF